MTCFFMQKFGDVDTSSAKGFLGSLRNSNSKGPSPPPAIPAAFASKQNNFAPPPARRAPSNVSAREPTPEPAPPPRAPAPPQRYQEEDEEEEGEWVEALYDYNSGVSGFMTQSSVIFIRMFSRKLVISR